ncbi:MAG: transaldolase [Gammaproteobacteria bacterium]|nr:transaldolase [Gammaproteobacteria bacterium]
MKSKLEQLREMTLVVADTGDIEAMKRFRPQDATTNPSLLLKAVNLDGYDRKLELAREWAAKLGGSDAEQLANACDRFAVSVGRDIVSLIPGRISTEVDARLSFDTTASIERARKLIGLYEEAGVPRDRILIKLASTWEGIRAAEQLEREQINCNLTLLFGFSQAAACADAGVYLISPFVGRIRDWYLANTDLEIKRPEDDPGVQSVQRIYAYYKQHDYQTVVMGASFRNTGEIEALAGCDRLTISPDLMEELDHDMGELPRQLSPGNVRSDDPKVAPSEAVFRYDLNDDAMAIEKLAEGIRNFVKDQVKLENLIRQG